MIYVDINYITFRRCSMVYISFITVSNVHQRYGCHVRGIQEVRDIQEAISSVLGSKQVHCANI